MHPRRAGRDRPPRRRRSKRPRRRPARRPPPRPASAGARGSGEEVVEARPAGVGPTRSRQNRKATPTRSGPTGVTRPRRGGPVHLDRRPRARAKWRRTPSRGGEARRRGQAELLADGAQAVGGHQVAAAGRRRSRGPGSGHRAGPRVRRRPGPRLGGARPRGARCGGPPAGTGEAPSRQKVAGDVADADEGVLPAGWTPSPRSKSTAAGISLAAGLVDHPVAGLDDRGLQAGLGRGDGGREAGRAAAHTSRSRSVAMGPPRWVRAER